jgi:ACR3 family arsenite efflux pump ArsB
MDLKIVALFLILFAVIIIVWGIAVVHTLPGKIAKKRGHSQVEAIEITSYLGLLVFPLWMGALIWAYLVPVKLKATVETSKGGEPDTGKGLPAAVEELPASVQVGDDEASEA